MHYFAKSSIRWVCFSIGIVAVASSVSAVKSETGHVTVQTVQPCATGHTLDPYQVWKEVSGPEEAEKFLREQYRRHGSIDKFSYWLQCQDFRVSLVHGPLGRFLKEGDSKIDAGFLVSGKDRKTLWHTGWMDYVFTLVWAQTFEIYINSEGIIYRVEIGKTVE